MRNKVGYEMHWETLTCSVRIFDKWRLVDYTDKKGSQVGEQNNDFNELSAGV